MVPVLAALQDEDVGASLAQVAGTPAGQATIALEVIALVTMLPFLYTEVATFIEYGRSWLNLQNAIDALTYINQARCCTPGKPWGKGKRQYPCPSHCC